MYNIGQTKEVQRFVSDLLDTNQDKGEIVVELYKLFKTHNKTFTDKFIYGGIGVYLGQELIGGIWVSKNHVSLVFGDGYKLDDMHDVLQGAGKYRRHIKLKEFCEIESKHCSEYIAKLFNIYD